MKGISTVIATILMLMITIALSGTAYLYISGAFTQQTAAVIDVLDAVCSGAAITTTVVNQGTAPISAVTVTPLRPDGTATVPANCATGTLNPGAQGSCTVTRSGGANPIGTYSLSMTAPGARTVRGIVSCSTAA